MPRFASLTAALAATVSIATPLTLSAHEGYYRMPALHGDTLVFASEGDLWTVEATGGAARRLTTHLEEETTPAISPDGTMLAFIASYEGPREVYTMPIDGGVPTRRTYGADRPSVVGWTPDGAVLVASRHLSTLPEHQLIALDLDAGTQTPVPLAQASDGAYDGDGALYFTRFPFNGSHTKRYKGGTARNIWHFAPDMDEATNLTADHVGEDVDPMWWNGRVYFVSERDACMNLWSMRPDGGDLRQHTSHTAYDVKSPTLHDGVVVYQHGADLRRLDLRTSANTRLDITLASDLDQLRETWITNPLSMVTALDLSPTGDRVVLTARGEIFVAPTKPGRIVQIARRSDVRYREATFLPDGERVLALSDESGELDYWSFAANGYGDAQQLTDNATVHRMGTTVSPDGRYIAWHDKNLDLWLHDLELDLSRRIAQASQETFSDLTWAPNSETLAWTEIGGNQFRRIVLYDLSSDTATTVTSDRVHSSSPAFSADGTWLYFLSDRHFENATPGVWGDYQPEPRLVNQTGIFVVDLTGTRRSPFQLEDELTREAARRAKQKADTDAASETAPEPDTDADTEADTDTDAESVADTDAESVADTDADAAPDAEPEPEPDTPPLNLDGILRRTMPVPVGTADRGALLVAESALFWLERDSSGGPATLKALAIDATKEPKPATVAERVSAVGLSADRKQLLVRSGNTIAVVPAKPGKADLSKNAIDLGGWTFPMDPREAYRQMFAEAWRLHRDYFYDPGMHGIDWDAMRERYEPLAARVGSRAELNDVLAQMVGELSALHTYVVGGTQRDGDDSVNQGTLGAQLERVDAGWRIAHVYEADPDFPDEWSPLARPDLDVREGDVITHINGIATTEVRHPGVLLRGEAGRPVRLRLAARDDAEHDEPRDVLVEPLSTGGERELRYDAWEYQRRTMVDDWSDREIGYVHIRSMGGARFAEDFARNFYPVHDRAGLIIDVRHNTGGNIDSWIIEKLMRQAWMYWQGRAGEPTWNMQYAFRGHLIVLCDERTASDGEAFCAGIRRLGLGEVIGTRTWGGEIWLSFANRLVDNGLASAAEYGVYGPEGEWLIEGHGFEPDVVVDNLPHATFNGDDHVLRTAVQRLLRKIEQDPRPVPPPPPFPNLAP